MPRWLVAALSAFVAAMLAAGLVGVAVSRDGDGPAAPARPAPATSTTAPSGASSSTVAPSTTAPVPATGVHAVVPALQAFVEKERGLAFRQPVTVTLLADGPFEARVRESDEEDREEIREAEAVLEAMLLLDRGVDLAEEVERFGAGAILGFYDTETKELVVRGREPTPYVRTILVHELTHALEDQHFDLDREELGDEAFLGFQALAEGSAGRVEDAYRASLSSAERRSVAREEVARAASVPNVPAVVQVIFGFPYAFGPDLVAAILRAGGQPRLDAAYRDGTPASSEHVLHPSRYLRGDAPRPVPVPRADGTAFDEGEIGELFLSLMLAAHLDEDQADEASEGWGGDHYVAWRDGDRTCVRMTFVMDTPADNAQLTEALAAWAEQRGNGADADGLTLRTCG